MSLPTPILLEWATSASTLRPHLNALFGDLNNQLAAGDVIEWHISENSLFSSYFATDEYTLLTADLDGSSASLKPTFALGIMTDGIKYARVRWKRGADISSWSNTVSKTIAGVAPVLTGPTDLPSSSTTGVGSVTTDVSHGTLYGVASTSATPPSKAQVKAGQMHTGAAAAASANEAITSAGLKDLTFAGLTPAATYYVHFMHEDAVGHQSDVVSADGFVAADVAFDVSFVEVATPQTTDASVYDFTLDIGVADPTRTIELVIGARQTSGTPNILSVTADGGNITGTETVAAEATGLGTWHWALDIPSGTEATFRITFAATVSRCVCATYRIVGTGKSVTDTEFTTSATATSLARTPTIPTDGVAICTAAFLGTDFSSPFIDWTNATRDSDLCMEGADTQFSSARRTTAGSTEITATHTVAWNSNAALSVSVWGP